MLGNASDELDALLCALAVIVLFFVEGSSKRPFLTLFQIALLRPSMVVRYLASRSA